MYRFPIIFYLMQNVNISSNRILPFKNVQKLKHILLELMFNFFDANTTICCNFKRNIKFI